MSREVLRVQNFAGLKDAEIELSRMNVFIGPQASGKSVCAKLIYFFRGIFQQLPTDIANGETKISITASQRDKFLRYFPSSAWGHGAFSISYKCEEIAVVVTRKDASSTTVKITFNAQADNILAAIRYSLRRARNESAKKVKFFQPLLTTKNALAAKLVDFEGIVLENASYFIPAGRSFFSTIEGYLWKFISDNIHIDPFIAEFGKFTGNAQYYYFIGPIVSADTRQVDDIVYQLQSNILGGVISRTKDRLMIHSSDGRNVPLETASSGQQEVVPLAMILHRFAISHNEHKKTTLFVEEPEAHLFSTAQRDIVHLLAHVLDVRSSDATSQYIITTHSPYILSSLNNLMYAEQIIQKSPDLGDRVSAVMNGAELVPPENVRAYLFKGGEVSSIIDPETNLVLAIQLDEVSNELAKEFDALMDIEFEDAV